MKMKRTTLAALVALAAAVVYSSAGGAAPCKNPGTQWVIMPSYPVDGLPNRITGDSMPYVSGQTGVTAVIQVCSGSYDATIDIGSRSGRSIWFSFRDMLVTNAYTPQFALDRSTVKVTRFNVRNLWFVPAGKNRSQDFTFTTRLGASLDSGANAPMLAPEVDAPRNTTDNLTIANDPYPNSPVQVLHCSGDVNSIAACAGVMTETWFVYPDPNPTASGTANGLPITQVGALLVQAGSGKNAGTKNGGEYSATFFFGIAMLD